jgi:iron complex transport system substrate-binding protein
MTELLFAIGAGPKVVGRSKWDEYPPEALAVPSVGDGLAPNVEAVAGTKPDLVLLYASPRNAGAVAQLAQLGIPAANYRMDRLADVPRLARIFGRFADQAMRAESLSARFEQQLDSARGAARLSRSGPTVAIVTWTDPPDVLGSASFLNEIVELAGGRNVFADVTAPDATVSVETIAARQPDVLVLLDSNAVATLSRRPEWRVVGAVRDRRFVVVHGTEFGQPSFRALSAVTQLRRAFAQRSARR